MKSTTLAIVSVLLPVMASGCAATTDEGFEQEALDDESIGSIQQAVVTQLAWGNLVCGSVSSIKAQIGYSPDNPDEELAATALAEICWQNQDANLVVMKSLLPLWKYYDAKTGLEFTGTGSNKQLWYAPVVTTTSSNKQFDARWSCASPYAHLMFKSTGLHTWNDCQPPSDWAKYREFTSQERIDECANIMATTAAKNQSAANGTPFAANCLNFVVLDPLVPGAPQCKFLC